MTLQTVETTAPVATVQHIDENQPHSIEALYHQMLFHLAEHDRLGNEGKERLPEYMEHYERFCSAQVAIEQAPAKTTKDAIFKIATTTVQLALQEETLYNGMIRTLESSINALCREAGIEKIPDLKYVTSHLAA